MERIPSSGLGSKNIFTTVKNIFTVVKNILTVVKKIYFRKK
jgi:hypothetical protein